MAVLFLYGPGSLAPKSGDCTPIKPSEISVNNDNYRYRTDSESNHESQSEHAQRHVPTYNTNAGFVELLTIL